MDKKRPTAERIVEASRRLFNKKGYAATSLTEIAEEVGISQGNLSYHFPTKRDLVQRLRNDAQKRSEARRAARVTGPVAEDYVEHLLFAMTMMWEYRFVFRDHAQYTDVSDASDLAVGMEADFDELHDLLKRMENDGMFRPDLGVKLETLTRSLWILSRYWMDHLTEYEGREEITWQDQERGIDHHFAVLFPGLVMSARKDLNDALAAHTVANADDA